MNIIEEKLEKIRLDCKLAYFLTANHYRTTNENMSEEDIKKKCDTAVTNMFRLCLIEIIGNSPK